MKNLIIYSLLIVVFFNCSSKVYTYKSVYAFERDLSNVLYKKKTGVFRHPNLGVECSLKKGEYHGVFKIMNQKDTFYYCKFNKGIPYGRYKCDFQGQYSTYYLRVFPNPNFSFVKRRPNKIPGYGFYNHKGQKVGKWLQYFNTYTSEGYYEKGIKHGLWEKYYHRCIGGGKDISYKKVLYLNGKLIKVLDSL